jgi:LysM repeat protein
MENYNSKSKISCFLFIVLFFVFCALYFYGCATIPSVTPTRPEGISGIYHRVAKGETLWRISKIYDVDLEELVRINHILDNTKIEIGQLIFIPQGKKQSFTSIGGEDFIWPLRGRVITDFNQIYEDMINKGINIKPYNDFNVLAARSGKVIFYSPNFKSYGKTIILDHGDGFLTVYARNSEVFIKTGDYVSRGTVISKVEETGNDKNNYLHFEIRRGHLAQNPNFYLQ